MSKGNGGMIAMLAGGMAGMFVASAVGGGVITNINGNKTEEINITGIKDAYVVCSHGGVDKLHKAKIEYLKSDPQQEPVDFNKLTFKCNNESIINKRVKISESKPEDEEYNLVCPDCFAD